VSKPATDLIQTKINDGIMTIHFNRPDKKNAVTSDMYDAMATAITDADARQDINVIIFTGSKDAFCAGNDLQDFLMNPPASDDAPVFKFLNAIAETDIPLVAAVDGVAVGVGVTMLLHCDFVYMSEDAKLSLPFINLGLVPEAGSSMLLPNLAGHQRAAELLLLGENFTPDEAKEIGLVNKICPSDDLHATAMKTAKKLAAKPRNALLQTKALMRRDFEAVTKRISKEADIFKECLGSPETKEALSAFKEKRKPDFTQFRKKPGSPKK